MSDPTAYRSPEELRMAIVEEGFAQAEPRTDLPPLFLGAAFKILDKESVGPYTKVQEKFDYPDLGGAVVDEDSVEVALVHEDTGTEYDITDGDDYSGVLTVEDDGVTLPANLRKQIVAGTTGRRSGGNFFSDAAKDFSGLRYGDELVLLDNGNENHFVNQVDSNGVAELMSVIDAESILYYDALVATKHFEAGQTVQGGASGAVAPIIAAYEDGTEGYLILGTIVGGPFTDGEDLEIQEGVPWVKYGEANGVNAQVDVDSYLAFVGLTAPGAISAGDTLEGPEGPDLILNGDFATDLSDWTAGAQWSWNAGGWAQHAAVAADDLVQTATTFEAGKSYYLVCDVTCPAGQLVISAGGVVLGTIVAPPVGSLEYTFTALNANPLTFAADIAFTGTVDNVVCGELTLATVLYVEETTTTSGFVLIGSLTGDFVDGDVLSILGAPVAEANGAQILLALNVDRTYDIRRYLEGGVYVSLRACRNDYVDEIIHISATGLSDLYELAGGEEAVTTDNPLFKAAELALQLGSDCYLAMVDDLEGTKDPANVVLSKWTHAFDLAKESLNPYAYVPLVQATEVLSLMEVHLNWKRDPDNYMREVVGYFCMPRVTEDIAVETRTADVGFTDATHFEDGGISSFVSYGCLAGRYLEIFDTDGTVYKYQVIVVADHVLTTSEAVPVAVQALKSYRYVNEYFTLAKEATYLRQFGEAYQNKAIRFFSPYTWELEGEEVPGYYGCVVRAAQMNVNNPSHIYTGEVIPFFTRVFNPFTKREHLNEIASGGIQVFVQNAASTVKCRDAITSDRTNAAREEETVVTQIDYAARYIRAVFLPMQGRNHTDDMIDDAIATLAGGCESHLVKKKRILGRLELIKYEIDESEPRLINYEWSALPRFPNKWSDMILRVVSR